MSNPARQRPGPSSEIGRRRLTANVEEPQLTANVEGPPAVPTVSPPGHDDTKVPISTRVPQSTLTDAKAAVMATAGHPDGCRSLADLITQAIDAKVTELAARFNNGQPFPQHGQFRTGRPLGS